MSRLRWAEAAHGCTDLFDEGGTLRGYVMTIGAKFRGYIIEHRDRLARFAAMQDFPAHAGAMAWVEKAVEEKHA